MRPANPVQAGMLGWVSGEGSVPKRPSEVEGMGGKVLHVLLLTCPKYQRQVWASGWPVLPGRKVPAVRGGQPAGPWAPRSLSSALIWTPVTTLLAVVLNPEMEPLQLFDSGDAPHFLACVLN